MASDENFPLALPQRTILAGQYVIEKVLGQGGFGITYKATDHKTGRSVAVKEFFPDSMAARTTQTMVSAFSGERGENFAYGKGCFLQEAETLAQFIGNENIVRVYSYFEENGTAYFVMEFIEGKSFDEYIKERGGKVTYEEAEKILLPVIDALALVHAKGIVHRDVTPDNIYITKDGRVKLLDFGAARYSLGDKSRSLDVVLKHGYAPKEQYTRRGRQGPYTDVYTVGASFYFAITGRRPPDSIDRLEEDELIPPSSLGVKIAPDKEDAILKAMSVQPANRYQTMGEFRQALMGTAGAQPGMSQAQEAPPQTSMPVPQAAPQTVQQRVFTEPQAAAQVTPQPAPMQQPQPTPVQQPTPVPQQMNTDRQSLSMPEKPTNPLLLRICAGYAALAVVMILVNSFLLNSFLSRIGYGFYDLIRRWWFPMGIITSAIMFLAALVLSLTVSKDRRQRMIMLIETGISLLLSVAVMLIFRYTGLYLLLFRSDHRILIYIVHVLRILSAGCIVESGFFKVWGREKTAALCQILAGAAMILLAIVIVTL